MDDVCLDGKRWELSIIYVGEEQLRAQISP